MQQQACAHQLWHIESWDERACFAALGGDNFVGGGCGEQQGWLTGALPLHWLM